MHTFYPTDKLTDTAPNQVFGAYLDEQINDLSSREDGVDDAVKAHRAERVVYAPPPGRRLAKARKHRIVFGFAGQEVGLRVEQEADAAELVAHQDGAKGVGPGLPLVREEEVVCPDDDHVGAVVDDGVGRVGDVETGVACVSTAADTATATAAVAAAAAQVLVDDQRVGKGRLVERPHGRPERALRPPGAVHGPVLFRPVHLQLEGGGGGLRGTPQEADVVHARLDDEVLEDEALDLGRDFELEHDPVEGHVVEPLGCVFLVLGCVLVLWGVSGGSTMESGCV